MEHLSSQRGRPRRDSNACTIHSFCNFYTQTAHSNPAGYTDPNRHAYAIAFPGISAISKI